MALPKPTADGTVPVSVDFDAIYDEFNIDRTPELPISYLPYMVPAFSLVPIPQPQIDAALVHLHIHPASSTNSPSPPSTISKSQFRELAQYLIASLDETAHYRAIFDLMVGQGDSPKVLDFERLHNLAQELGQPISSASITDMLDLAGSDGTVDFDEFVAIIKKAQQYS
ncbi:hypothetical protein AYI68_g7217 [Smittium mucronatum]|uniref:Caltractin n=1 Tax=Smittium mucronatum TaxID=133383 RepID=A0A1R0GPD4_9FUNG|nr:hypothetical protein AYI68_g7217 [Smittium mucronatum]